MGRQSRKQNMMELKRQAVIKNLHSMGITHSGSIALHNLDYSEVKWMLALELAKGERDL